MPRITIPVNHPNYDPGYEGIGVLASRFMGDPRINRKQMDAITKTCEADSEALIMGIDENMLPVVRARVGIPRDSRAWAIKRNGDPATPGRIFDAFHGAGGGS